MSEDLKHDRRNRHLLVYRVGDPYACKCTDREAGPGTWCRCLVQSSPKKLPNVREQLRSAENSGSSILNTKKCSRNL